MPRGWIIRACHARLSLRHSWASSTEADGKRCRDEHHCGCRLGYGDICYGTGAVFSRLAEVGPPRIVIRLADEARIVRVAVGDGGRADLAAPSHIVSAINLAVVVVIAGDWSERDLQHARVRDQRRVVGGVRVADRSPGADHLRHAVDEERADRVRGAGELQIERPAGREEHVGRVGQVTVRDSQSTRLDGRVAGVGVGRREGERAGAADGERADVDGRGEAAEKLHRRTDRVIALVGGQSGGAAGVVENQAASRAGTDRVADGAVERKLAGRFWCHRA